MQSKPITSHPQLFCSLTILFFIWGSVTILNDLLVPLFKNSFHLSYFDALLIQFSFFIAYFLMALPMTYILNKLQYKKSLIIGLSIILFGCWFFVIAYHKNSYHLFLFALFILASGVVMLQVSANTLITLLGDTDTSSARLTLAQGFNSLGYIATPLLLASVFTLNKLP